ncbi:MAG: glycoside hydrolase family 16 protein, partial [Oscillospiraceae bacterium]|nr:glycoside hydrolase family 16 protein [Oscillospiraceae bacterium]
MKKTVSIILAVLMMFSSSLLFSCGDDVKGEQTDTGEISEKADDTETGDSGSPDAGSPEDLPEEPDKKIDVSAPDFEYEYVAPADGSFRICGTDLSEYTITAYMPNGSDTQRRIMRCVGEDILAATGMEIKVDIDVNKEYLETPKAEHEILIGSSYRRDGMPEIDPMDNVYGVTADGTVYFSSFNRSLYPDMFRLFLEEFMGYEKDSGEKSRGCDIHEFTRKLPDFDPKKLEAAGYVLVADDEFDGDSMNTDLWEYRGHGARSQGFLADSQVTVEDGVLNIIGEYLEDGEYGEGWYTSAVALKQWYCKGYFEARIRVSEMQGTSDFWSAFWIQGPHPYEAELSQGGAGPGGAELDIMENFGPRSTSCNIWISGYDGDDDLCSDLCIVNDLAEDYSKEFHTYSLLWDDDYYRIYVDGKLLNCSDFGYGTSPADEQVILSLEPSDEFKLPLDTVRTMTVDYVKIWQIPVFD